MREASGHERLRAKFFEVKNEIFGRLSFFGRLVCAGGYWVREASGCGRLVGAGG